MAETSLGRLQKTVDKQNKIIFDLRNRIEQKDEKIKELKQEIKSLKELKESKIENAVNRAVSKVTKEYTKEIEKLKKENEHMKRILNHDSNNTGLPTSKTSINKEKRIPNSRQKTNKKPGGQKGHLKHKLERFSDDEITDTYQYDLKNKKCSCGGKLEKIGTRNKDEFDIDIRLKKVRHEFGVYQCNKCQKEVKVPIPDRLKEENQYGSNVKSLAVSLLNEGFVSFHRVRELISGFTGNEINMSEGYLAKLQKESYKKLEAFDNDLHKEILKQKVICWDDTVIDIDKKRACLRVYTTPSLAYYKAHKKKDKDGIDEDGILNVLSSDTVVMHDHNKVNYNSDYNFTNAECCVHLIRDLKELNENLPRDWINKIIKLLVDTNKKRKEYINQRIEYFDQEVTDKVSQEYDNILSEADKISNSDKNKYYHKDEVNLIKRLREYKEEYLLWTLRFDVPFSDNLSERSLRGAKTKMKVSGQFKNLSYAEYFARIKSYIETCKRNGINSHIALKKLLEGNPFTIEEIKKCKKTNEN